MRHFRPEVEERLRQFHAKNGGVMFGGHLVSEQDRRFAIPDNLGGHVQRAIAQS